MKPYALMILLPALFLTGCPVQEELNPYAELEDQTRGYGGTASSLVEDSDDEKLKAFLQTSKEEEKRLLSTIQELRQADKIDHEQAEKLKQTHSLLNRLQAEKFTAILRSYEEITVEFVDLNQWKLLPEAKTKLRIVQWDNLCPAARKIIVYGYGDPIGGTTPTQQISLGRAQSVANWMAANTPCRADNIVARGLGVDVKSEQIDTASISSKEKESLYRKSRYARILIPKQ